MHCPGAYVTRIEIDYMCCRVLALGAVFTHVGTCVKLILAPSADVRVLRSTLRAVSCWLLVQLFTHVGIEYA